MAETASSLFFNESTTSISNLNRDCSLRQSVAREDDVSRTFVWQDDGRGWRCDPFDRRLLRVTPQRADRHRDSRCDLDAPTAGASVSVRI